MFGYDQPKNSQASSACVRYSAGTCRVLREQEGRLSTNITIEKMQMITPSTRQTITLPQKLRMPVINIKTPRMVAMLMLRFSVNRSLKLQVTSSWQAEITEDVPSAKKMMLIRTRVSPFFPDFFLVAIVNLLL